MATFYQGPNLQAVYNQTDLFTIFNTERTYNIYTVPTGVYAEIEIYGVSRNTGGTAYNNSTISVIDPAEQDKTIATCTFDIGAGVGSYLTKLEYVQTSTNEPVKSLIIANEGAFLEIDRISTVGDLSNIMVHYHIKEYVAPSGFQQYTPTVS